MTKVNTMRTRKEKVYAFKDGVFSKKELASNFTRIASKYEWGLTFYGEFLHKVNIIMDKDGVNTAGVNVTNRGFNLYMSSEFISKLTVKEFNFLMVHEMMHLLFDHQSRTIKGGYNQKYSNVVQDWIINKIIIDHYNSDNTYKSCDFIEGGTLLPDEYDGELVFEPLYKWLMEQKDEYDKDKNSVSKQLQEIFDSIKNGERVTTDVHLENEVNSEVAKSLADEFIRGMKNAGKIGGGMENILGQLRKNKKDYTKKIKTLISRTIGTERERTMYRKRKPFLHNKGKKRVGRELTVISDVSGSMHGYLETTHSAIFRDGIAINLILADTQVTKAVKVKNKRQLQNLTVKGYGGTELQPAVNYAKETYPKHPILILTDGYCDSLDVSGFRDVLILTVKVDVNITNGKARQLKIEKE